MASSAISAQGCVLSQGGVAIAEIRNIRGPGETAAQIDVTSHSSTGNFKEYISGFLDGGEFTLEGNLIVGDAGQVALHAAYAARSSLEYVLTFPTAVTATWTFTAIVTNFATEFPYDAQMSFTATLKVSGQPALGVTASDGVSACTFAAASGAITPAPTFAVGVTAYNLTVTGTDSYIKVTATFTGTALVRNVATNTTTTLTTTVQSAEIALTVDVVTHLRIEQKNTGKTPNNYDLYIVGYT